MVSTTSRARARLRLGLCGTAMTVLIAMIAVGHATADAQQVRIELAAPAPETVWRHADEGAPCAPNDYADVPVRPFLVNGAASGSYRVLWFAANSQGYFASETPGPDLAPADVTLATSGVCPIARAGSAASRTLEARRSVTIQGYGWWPHSPATNPTYTPSSTTNFTVNGRDHRAGARNSARRFICRAFTGT
jgi:hypothetical protein